MKKENKKVQLQDTHVMSKVRKWLRDSLVDENKCVYKDARYFKKSFRVQQEKRGVEKELN